MNALCLCLSFGFWILMMMHDCFFILAFGLAMIWFLWLRFHKTMILGIWCLCMGISLLLCMPVHKQIKPGVYQIIEIKNSYCIVKKDKMKLIAYGLKNPNYYDGYYISSVKPIQTVDNENVFSFKRYMARQGIEYGCYLKDEELVSSSHSIRSRLYAIISSNNFYKENLYGIKDKETIGDRLGIPVIGILYILNQILRRYLKSSHVQVIMLIFAILYGYLFTFHLSLVRYLCFQLGKILFSKWQKQLSFSIFLFLLMVPYGAAEFTFVLPVLLQCVNKLELESIKKAMAVKAVLFFLQLIYFHEINFIFVFCFGFIRKIYGYLVLLSFVPVLRHFIFFLCQDCLSKIETTSVLHWYYVPGILFYIVLILFFAAKKHRQCILCILCILPFVSSYINPFFQVNMINIGQGDCILIVEPFHKSAVMIDCGQSRYRDNVKDIMAPVLKGYQVHRLDALILTHDDFDHSGGYEELKKEIVIEKVIRKRNQKVPVSYPFYSLLPKRNSDDENDSSIVNYVSYDKLHYLFMGDASHMVEEKLLKTYKLDVDILKLGHHGSHTSSSYDFLDALRPEIGLISVGADNRYGHPSSAVVSNCHDLGIHILETSQVGNIHIYSFHNLAFFTTASGLFGIINT